MNKASEKLIHGMGTALAEARKGKKLSIRAVSEEAGIAFGTYRTLENGGGDPRISSFAQAADAIGYRVVFGLVPKEAPTQD